LPLQFNFCRAKPPEDPTNKWMTYRKMQMILRQEGGDDGLPVECCPTIEEMVEPVGGRTREDMYVELYRDGENVQRFFEYSCRPDVLDKPCRFVDRKFSNQSRCVQKFSYTYAIIQNPGSKVQSRNVKFCHNSVIRISLRKDYIYSFEDYTFFLILVS